MTADEAFAAAQSRYATAYQAYEQASQHVAQKLQSDLMPSTQELDASTDAAEHLALARRDLLDVRDLLVPRDDKT